MLKEKLSNYEIILASQSPRRIKFFNELDIKFRSIKLDFDESYPNNLSVLYKSEQQQQK